MRVITGDNQAKAVAIGKSREEDAGQLRGKIREVSFVVSQCNEKSQQ